MPIVIDRLRALLRFKLFGQVLFCFMAGSPFCTSSAFPIGSLSHPAGDRPSHPISVTHCKYARVSAMHPARILRLQVLDQGNLAAALVGTPHLVLIHQGA